MPMHRHPSERWDLSKYGALPIAIPAFAGMTEEIDD